MKCPIDNTDLVMSDRQGIEIDYCPQCRGVWLDRGEIDKIVERSMGQGGGQAPQGYQQQPQQHQAPQGQHYQQPQQHGYNQHRDYDDDDYHGGHNQHGKHNNHHRRESWLGDLFD